MVSFAGPNFWLHLEQAEPASTVSSKIAIGACHGSLPLSVLAFGQGKINKMDKKQAVNIAGRPINPEIDSADQIILQVPGHSVGADIQAKIDWVDGCARHLPL